MYASGDTGISEIGAAISRWTGRHFDVETVREAAGGCINTTLVVGGRGQRYFVKMNAPERVEMFAAEVEALQLLAAAEAVRVPNPICSGTAANRAYIALEFLDLRAGDHSSDARMGQQLARLHGNTERNFGWRRDNTIGSTPQHNTPDADWIEFWRRHRLGYQLDLAAQNGYSALHARGQELSKRLDAFFAGYRPVASLLHGDLWSGNCAVTAAGEPVIFDPASYYGDREADVAMTELFGGFSDHFYQAYRAEWPLYPGYATRKTLYNLYHVLNHLNLFGAGYLAQAERMLGRLLSEIG